MRKAVDRDRKSDERTRPANARPDRESFRFFQLSDDKPALLEDLVPGCEVATSRGPAWLSHRPLDEFWHPLPDLPEPDPTRIWFDIETRGGRGNPGFLFGAVHHEDGRWWLWQALARTTEEEPAMLELVTEFVQRHPRLVSYSGTKNDWPFLVSRWSRFDMVPPRHADHLDLFEKAQTLYRGVLPSC
ncbi:MAG TPA: ribonuclease H-like domain-containing protein, partial [Fibrobacteria bacterium]|nr:ribonuclease H-like domain-containing protein [Fibrobacteria bacterium]